MIQLVVFDMAGTTVNEQNVVYKTVHQAIEHAGYPVSLDTVLLIAAGKEKFEAVSATCWSISAAGRSACKLPWPFTAISKPCS